MIKLRIMAVVHLASIFYFFTVVYLEKSFFPTFVVGSSQLEVIQEFCHLGGKEPTSL